jgi:hypothetical protein
MSKKLKKITIKRNEISFHKYLNIIIFFVNIDSRHASFNEITMGSLSKLILVFP